MRKIQKILSGVFLGGILLCGIGTGVAFVEFSSFEYGGERQIGSDAMVTETIDFSFEPRQGRVIAGKSRWGNIRSSRITEDVSVPEGTIRYVVTYNKEMVKPYLTYEEFEEDEEAAEEYTARAGAEPESPESGPGAEEESGPGIKEKSEQESGQEPGRSSEARPNPDIKPEDETDSGREDAIQGYLRLYADNMGSEIKAMMGMKDMILDELKQRRISDYNVMYVEDVEIQVNPQTRPYVLDEDQYYGRQIIRN